MVVDLFRNTYNDDTDEKQLRNECERAKRAESFVYLHRKHTIFSIFRYNDVLVLFNLYGRNYKMYLQNSKNYPPPPVYATNNDDFNWKCGLHIDWVVRTFFFLHFLFFPPPPPGPRYSFLHLPFSQSSPSPSGSSPPPFFKSPLTITFSPFLLPYMPKICSIASKLFLFMKIQIFHILPGDLTVRSESYFLCGCLYATPI